jgi:hypothetical protein
VLVDAGQELVEVGVVNRQSRGRPGLDEVTQGTEVVGVGSLHWMTEK